MAETNSPNMRKNAAGAATKSITCTSLAGGRIDVQPTAKNTAAATAEARRKLHWLR